MEGDSDHFLVFRSGIIIEELIRLVDPSKGIIIEKKTRKINAVLPLSSWRTTTSIQEITTRSAIGFQIMSISWIREDLRGRGADAPARAS